MKHLITSAVLLTFSIQALAYNTFDQLCDFNPNWKNYENRVSKQLAKNIHSDVEYIQMHLTQVLEILSNNPIDHLSNQQAISRMISINHLIEYKNAGMFPINYYMSSRTPVFIDRNQTHCAVGYLIQQSGNEILAQKIAKDNNYAWVKEIKIPELLDWQKSSGFSLEELKLIQGAYDFYMDNAFFLPNRYEIPQKPEVIAAYFEGSRSRKLAKTEENIWCYGEGKNGILNGKWIQNYGVGIPWIEGYYQNGKRTGQWKEYYQGTNLLCRTENWRNDKLNGVRKRFNKKGEVIEEILFKNGVAALKTNYDIQGSIKSIRTPLDSNLVYTEIYTLGGGLLAMGNERIHNPGGLLWFQNIELTALNSASITSREFAQTGNSPFRKTSALYNTPPLVEYKKEGDWTYYKVYGGEAINEYDSTLSQTTFKDYPHFAVELNYALTEINQEISSLSLDSLNMNYQNNLIMSFETHSTQDPIRYEFTYQEYVESITLNDIYFRFYDNLAPTLTYQIESIGQVNENKERIGIWKYYNTSGVLFKTENYLIPFKEEEIHIVENR